MAENPARTKLAMRAALISRPGPVAAMALWSAVWSAPWSQTWALAAEPGRTVAPSTPKKSKGEARSNAGVDYLTLQELLETAKAYGHRKAHAFSCSSSQPNILYANPKIPFLKMARVQGASNPQLEALGDAYDKAAEANYQLVLTQQVSYKCDRERIETINLEDAKRFDPDYAAKMEAAKRSELQATRDAARESLQKSFQLISGQWTMHKFEDLGRTYNVPYKLGSRNRCYSAQTSDGNLMVVDTNPSDNSIVATLHFETVEATSCTEGGNPAPDRTSLALKLRLLPAGNAKYTVQISDCREDCSTSRALQLKNDGTLVYQTNGGHDIEFQRR